MIYHQIFFKNLSSRNLFAAYMLSIFSPIFLAKTKQDFKGPKRGNTQIQLDDFFFTSLRMSHTTIAENNNCDGQYFFGAFRPFDPNVNFKKSSFMPKQIKVDH